MKPLREVVFRCVLALLLFSTLCGLVASCSLFGADRAGAGLADRLFVNGNVLFDADADRRAEAVAVQGGQILFVGNEADARAYQGPNTEIIDLGGATLLTGLVDAHAHMEGLGAALETLDLVGTISRAQIVQLVSERAAEIPEGSWILGRGWDQNDWGEKTFPTARDLSSAAPDHPVFLTRIDGHAGWANEKAMEIASVDATTQDPDGGKVLRGSNGDPEGVFIDNGMGLIRRAIPHSTRQVRKRRLEMAVAECLRYGITEVHDAGVDQEILDLYEELAREGKLPFRIYAMVSATADGFEEILTRGPRIGVGGGRLTIRSVKAYADGALGSRGAALLSAYSDDPENHGLVITSEEELFKLTVLSLSNGFQVCTHAIGDRGNRLVLNAYEAALKQVKAKDSRLRIEHAQVLSRDDITRFRDLGVIASMQPTHCTSDMPWAPDRLGAERVLGAYAWRSLIDAGVVIACGSDFPVEKVDPLLSLYAGRTRQDSTGHPRNGFAPTGEKMTAAEVLRGHTSAAAFAAFQEKSRGTLKVGNDADMVVLDRDPIRDSASDVLNAKVLMTIVGGEVVYRQ